MKPKISVIIPVYNGEKTIDDTLNSVFKSSYKDFEVIAIDDGSIDGSLEILKKYPITIISLDNNSGPAFARNTGIKNVNGEIVVFIDSDVTIKEDALEKVNQTFEDKKDIDALIMMRSQVPLNKGLTPLYWALYKYSLWNTNEEYQTSFTTNRGAVRKEVFNRIGYFDTIYKGPDVEDYEFGYRMTNNKMKIFVNRDILVQHNHPTFKISIKKFFRRSYMWTRLFLKRKKFDNVYTTKSMGIKTLVGFLLIPLFMVSFFSLFLLKITFLIFLIFCLMNLNFYTLCIIKKRLLVFPLILLDIFFSFIIGLGGIASLIMLPIDLIRRTKNEK